MVGIHERSAREKISATSTAHVMHDEQTRKYLQAVKRLITFAQRRYPSTPSLSLEYDANEAKAALMLSGPQGAGEGGAAAQAQPVLLLEASAHGAGPDGGVHDGWRANDADTRTWKSIMRRAYADEQAGERRPGREHSDEDELAV